MRCRCIDVLMGCDRFDGVRQLVRLKRECTICFSLDKIPGERATYASDGDDGSD